MGPNGAPVIRTDHGSLVFPAKRSGSTTWLKQYRRNKSGAADTTGYSQVTAAPHHHPPRRRGGRGRGNSKQQLPFQHEIDPRLLSSAIPEIKTLTDFRHNVLFKPQRAVHLRTQIQVQAIAKRKREEAEEKKLAAAPDLADLSDFELLKVTLRDIRLHVEKLKVSGALDLRAFLNGAALEINEFARLFKTQIGVKLEGRKLDVVMAHFDKDGDGTLDYIEVHSQLMNPHRLHVSDAEASKEDMLQTALNKVRIKVMEKQQAKIKAGTAKEEDLINATTGGKKGKGPDLKSIFSHFDTDNSGVVAREEFVEALIKLGVDMNRFELNQLYWTLDPDRSGKLSYAEFSRMFFDRRTRLNQEKKKQKKKLLKPHWTPTNALQASEEISKDRRHMYCSINTPYKLEDKVAWQDDQERRDKVLYGLWQADRGGHHAKLLVDNKAFLNAPAVEAIAMESLYIHERAKEAKLDLLKRHDGNVEKYAQLLKTKQLLPPEVVPAKFGRWNTNQLIPIVRDTDVDDLLVDGTGDGDSESVMEYESDVDSMVGFRIGPEDWDMEDIARIKEKARE